MKTLYLSDLDGTLLRTDATLSRFSKRLLGGLIGRGMLFSYATARSFSSASVILRGLDLRLPAITYNGTFCVDAATGEVLANEAFTQAECDALVGLFAYHHLFPLVYSAASNGFPGCAAVKTRGLCGISRPGAGTGV